MYPRTMKRFDIRNRLPNGRVLVLGRFEYLYPGDTIVVVDDDEEYKAVVEKRVFDGAVARLVLER